MANNKTTIDCTPTWTGILNWYLAVLQDGNDKGKDTAKKELFRMAQIADNYVAIQPKVIALVEHISAMHDDAYLTKHPEWHEIVKEAKTIFQ